MKLALKESSGFHMVSALENGLQKYSERVLEWLKQNHLQRYLVAHLVECQSLGFS